LSAGEVHVLFFGDSHTVGVGDPTGLGWVGRVVAASHAAGIPLVAYDLGIRRETSLDVLRRWHREAEARSYPVATKVVFAVGANDTIEEDGVLRVEPNKSVETLGGLLRHSASAGFPAMVVGPDRNETWREEIAASDEAHPAAAGYEELARIVLDSGWLGWLGAEARAVQEWRRSRGMSHDLHSLPEDLPVPEDDGAGDRLLNATIPSVALSNTSGNEVDLAAVAAADGYLVVYVYPQTGVPGRPIPEGWDRIPGARGCTPQSCAFRDSAGELATLGASVFGLSSQPLGEQREFAEREHLPYPLLNDSGLWLARELGLPTFEANGVKYYRRLTFVARAGRIIKVFYPVFPPQDNAGDVITWLQAEGGLDLTDS
jgi:peroxiredoxin/lysophospholipase L1-like esterase